MKRVCSWENKKFDNYTRTLVTRVTPQMKDQLKLWNIRSGRDVSVFVRCAISEKLKRESSKETIGLYPLERRKRSQNFTGDEKL